MLPDSTTRVLIADDHPVFRRRLRRWLETWRGLEIIAEVEDGEAAVEATRRLAPDLVLMDVQMPREDGLAACRRIKQERQRTKVILFSAFARELAAPNDAGADAFLPKDRLFDELQGAVERVLADRD